MSAAQAAPSTVEYGTRRIIIVIGIMLATLLQTLDITIVNVALPVIQGNLGATIDEGAWIVTGYIISAVVIIPLTPWLQMRFGRRQYYATAIIGFTIASIFCGLSHEIVELIVWRVIQGAFGGGLVATAQATLRDIFPPKMLGTSQGIFALGAIVGPTVGPTLGGWITDNYTWNYVFFINIVPGAIASIIILTMLRNPSEPRRLPIDALGVAFLATGLGSLQYILDEGQRNDWFNDQRIQFFTATSVLGLIGFALWELFGTQRPIVDLRVLKYRSVWAGTLLGACMGATLFGSIVLLPQYTQSVLGFTATLSGELILVRAVVTALFTPFVVRVATSGRFDIRYMLLIGFISVGVANYLQSGWTTPNADFDTLVPVMLLSGFGLAMLFVPISIAVLSALPTDAVPKATAFVNLSLQLGGSFSTAALVTVLARREAFHQETIAASITPANAALQHALTMTSINQIYAIVLQQAQTLAYADASWLIGVGTFIITPLVFVLAKPKRRMSAPVSAE